MVARNTLKNSRPLILKSLFHFRLLLVRSSLVEEDLSGCVSGIKITPTSPRFVARLLILAIAARSFTSSSPGASVGSARGGRQCGSLVSADAHWYAYRRPVDTCVRDQESENAFQMSADDFERDILDP